MEARVEPRPDAPTSTFVTQPICNLRLSGEVLWLCAFKNFQIRKINLNDKKNFLFSFLVLRQGIRAWTRSPVFARVTTRVRIENKAKPSLNRCYSLLNSFMILNIDWICRVCLVFIWVPPDIHVPRPLSECGLSDPTTCCNKNTERLLRIFFLGSSCF